jgi:hypothetical protein
LLFQQRMGLLYVHSGLEYCSALCFSPVDNFIRVWVNIALKYPVTALTVSSAHTHNCDFILFFPDYSAPTEPLLCKFADGGQKKRQNPNKYIPNGRPWHREGEVRLVSPFLKLQCGCVRSWNLSGKVTQKASWLDCHTSETFPLEYYNSDSIRLKLFQVFMVLKNECCQIDTWILETVMVTS